MSQSELLGQLNGLHQMINHLLESSDDAACRRRFVTGLPPLAWLFGRAIYLESYWLREVVLGDSDITARVRHLFGHGVDPDEAIVQQLPPREHLLNWALELQEENLTLLANPRHLPAHELLDEGRLLYRLVEELGELCEAMIAQLTESRLTAAPTIGWRTASPRSPPPRCTATCTRATIASAHGMKIPAPATTSSPPISSNCTPFASTASR
ncbi:MAG: hypothetical protein OQL08_05430 [Gammaproteobacteria bacterium]|nr:hypothetical protein [Gammaproteobacteria bacterium]